MKRLITVIALLCCCLPVAAQQCIQAPKRTAACPNLLYRVGQLPGMEKPAMLCICATDFTPLLTTPDDESAQIRQRMTRRQLEAELGIPLEPILRLLSRQD